MITSLRFDSSNATQWTTKWTLGEKSKVHFCKIQLVLDILRTMDYLMASKVLLQSSSRVENEVIKNQPEDSAIYTTHILFYRIHTEVTNQKQIYIINLHNVRYRFIKKSGQLLLKIP